MKHKAQLYVATAQIIEQGSVPDEATMMLHITAAYAGMIPTGYTAYTLNGIPYARQTRWDRYKDEQRAEQSQSPIEPNIDIKDCVLPPSAYFGLMEEARSLHVPLFHHDIAIGFDGVTYTLLLTKNNNALLRDDLRLTWWLEGKGAWKPFTEWATRFYDLMQDTCNPTR